MVRWLYAAIDGGFAGIFDIMPNHAEESISMKDAFIIGLAQACAVMPGLSRSGSTIATGLLLGNNKAKLASSLS